MKARRSILLFSAVAILLIGAVIWLGKKPSTIGSREPANPTNMAASPTEPAGAEQAGSPLPPTRDTRPGNTPQTNVPASAAQSALDDPRRGLAALNDVPIVFYGKLEDQFSNPVVAARIDASVRIYNGFKSTVERFVVTSDSGGFFHIDHGKGEGLGIGPSKEGYVLAAPNTYFKYSYMYPDRFAPDPAKPAVIKMWKVQGPQPLTGIQKEFRLPFTGAPVSFDLITGNVVGSGGDLEVEITRAPGTLSKKTPADWSIKIKAVDGGIMESDYETARATYEAPAGDYQDSLFVQMNREDQAWFDSLHKMFFLKSRGGQVYSKFNFDFGINREPNGLMYFQFRGVANTNASRNWEATAPQR
jgi:hypothetical protein